MDSVYSELGKTLLDMFQAGCLKSSAGTALLQEAAVKMAKQKELEELTRKIKRFEKEVLFAAKYQPDHFARWIAGWSAELKVAEWHSGGSGI